MQVKYMQVSLAEPKDTHMSGSGKKNLATRNFELLDHGPTILTW